ncbi:MAG TPA: UDP-N-acetylmuramoyl-L-alanine--D-glutamate ligase [Candidatus Dormibacteraeota bacterium]
MASGKALVIGAGLSGRALVRHLSARGIAVRVVDLKRPDPEPSFPPGVQVLYGPYEQIVLEGVEAVYASPGVPWDDPLLEEARRRGLTVSSEIDLFFRECPAPIVGITGTNGKTTTTALTGEVLRQGARPVLVGGNIGETVLDRLEEITPAHWVVLELSSFQLESVARPQARIGAVLNLTPDHLDRHHTMDAYVAAKARLVEFMEPEDTAVLNGIDARVRELAGRTQGQVVWFDQHRPDPPMPIPGPHNLMNARAAAAIGRVAGLDDAAIDRAIAGFQGVEHRLELVGEWEGVRWYNDSKATNPDAGQVGVASFSGTPLVLIAGGYGSGFELAAWAEEVRRRTRLVILIGQSADLLEETLQGHPVKRAASLEEAVEVAAAEARPGEVVLLSPAYKSFDMFKSYEDRGRRFKAAVRAHYGVVA